MQITFSSWIFLLGFWGVFFYADVNELYIEFANVFPENLFQKSLNAVFAINLYISTRESFCPQCPDTFILICLIFNRIDRDQILYVVKYEFLKKLSFFFK